MLVLKHTRGTVSRIVLPACFRSLFAKSGAKSFVESVPEYFEKSVQTSASKSFVKSFAELSAISMRFSFVSLSNLFVARTR